MLVLLDLNRSVCYFATLFTSSRTHSGLGSVGTGALVAACHSLSSVRSLATRSGIDPARLVCSPGSSRRLCGGIILPQSVLRQSLLRHDRVVRTAAIRSVSGHKRPTMPITIGWGLRGIRSRRLGNAPRCLRRPGGDRTRCSAASSIEA